MSIEARALTRRYGDKTAVDDLTFTARPGAVTGFPGPNGAGKTTTIRLVLGLDYPTKGSATVNGKPFSALYSPMREVGALLDAKAVHGGRSAYNHLLCLAQANDIPRGRVDEVLPIVGLSEVARKRSSGFSLGMNQRLGIAATLLGDPGRLMTSVLIADDHALQRLGFRMLESQPDLAVAGEAANGMEAVRLAAELHPDVVLMDIHMPGLDGIEATRRITNAGARPRVLILTTFDLDEYAFAGLRAGASGFLVKDAQPTELLAGIHAVAAGDAVVAPALTRRLIEKYAHLLPARAEPSPSVGPTARSPTGCTSPSPPSRRTSAGSWPRSTPATASRPSSSPTTPTWSAPP